MNQTSVILPVVLGIVLIVLLTSKVKLNAFFALTLTALALAAVTLPPGEIVGTLKTGFGNTLGAIGLIILFGTTIGVLLDRTGAAWALAHSVLRLTGREKAPRAISITGFLAGLPIFCDSGFIILSSLNKSLAASSGTAMVRMAASLAISLYTLHCLIPPHPGITAAAGIMGGSIGKVVLFGTLIAIPTTLVGYVWVKLMSGSTAAGPMNGEPARAPAKVPGTIASLLPILAPLVLISANSSASLLGIDSSPVGAALKIAGDPVIALLIGVVVALPLLRGSGFQQANEMLVEAVEKAGPILIITAAGGAFGAVIRATGFGEQVSNAVASWKLGLLLPFALAAILKTGQGSSTVAALTTASIVTPMLAALGLDSENGRVLALLAIGSGSMMVSHANDSYFWVISKFSDLSVQATLKVYSTATIVISLCSFLLTWTLSLIL